MTKFFFVYVVFYEYAYIGEILFGGKLTFEVYTRDVMQFSPPLYYLMNFNDFGASIVVLF